MKLAIIHTDFRLYWPARLKALTDILDRHGDKLTIVEIAGKGSPYSFAGQSRDHSENWICLFPERAMEDIKPGEARSALIQFLDKIDPDILISGPIAFSSGATAVYWSVKRSKKIIVFDDARLEDVPRPFWINYIKRRVYSPVNAIFCPSKQWVKTFSFFGFKRERIFFGVNVVNNDFWYSDDQKKVTTPGCFLAVGRLIPKKNFLFLLKAYMRYLQKAESKINKLIIVGEGPEENNLRRFILENNLSEFVKIQEFVSAEKLKEVYRNASWFILPSKYGETWGLVVNEAMASGLPVLVSRQAGCASSLVVDGLNGFTFSPENEDSLVDLMSAVSNLSNAQRELMGSTSTEIIRYFGIDHFCEGILKAVTFTKASDIIRPGLVAGTIIRFWKGRYRPV